MAKISDYGNYKTGKTDAEVEKFDETGVIPVSGKYTANGKMETKNVLMSELLGGGSDLPPTTGAEDGYVLTYKSGSPSDEIVWAAPAGGGGGSSLPDLPTVNGTGGSLSETQTMVALIGYCDYADNFTLKWEYCNVDWENGTAVIQCPMS